MLAKLKAAATTILLELLERRAFRTLARRAPQPFQRFERSQLNILKEARERASSAEERRAFEAAIGAVEEKREARRAALLADGGRLERLFAELSQFSDECSPGRLRQWMRRLDKDDLDALVGALGSPMGDQFQFRQGARDFLRLAAARTRQMDSVIVAVRRSASWPEAKEAMETLAPVTGFGAARDRDVPDHELILIDNALPLALAAALQAGPLPSTRLKFANRCTIDRAFDEEYDPIRRGWTAIMESDCAFFSEGEARLDAAFLTWRDRARPVLSALFSRPAGAFLDDTAFSAFDRIFEDAAYIAFREFWSWRSAIWGAGPSAGAARRVLMISNRPELAEALIADAEAAGAELSLSLWSPHTRAPAVGGDTAATQSASHMASLENFNAIADKPTGIFDTVVITASNVANYSDYALKLAAARKGRTLIIDTHPRPASGEIEGKAAACGAQWVNAATLSSRSPAANRDVLTLASACRRALCAAEIGQHPATRLLTAGRALEDVARRFIGLQHALAFTMGVTSETQGEHPHVYFAPGRTHLAMAIADRFPAERLTDIQFFMTSPSFRHKASAAGRITVIDDQEKDFLQTHFGLPDEAFAALGSPSVQLYFRSRMKPPSDMLSLERWSGAAARRILFIVQPHAIDEVKPLLAEFKKLLERDRRCALTIKMHHFSSNGLIGVFRAHLGSAACRQTTFDSTRGVYEAIPASDLVVGHSSNALLEAASIRKGVILIESSFSQKFMARRQVGVTSPPSKLADEIARYFDDPGARRENRDAQNAYFTRNPGMDAFGDEVLLDKIVTQQGKSSLWSIRA